MFGFIDLLAVRDGEVLAVQTTSASNVSSRVKKIADHDNVAIIRKAGIRIEVHGWEKRGNRWEVRVVDIS
jgi:carbonic anhydrase